jgi:hypothetical protein
VSTQILSFTVHRGGRRPRRVQRVSPLARKVMTLEQVNPNQARFVADLIERLLQRAASSSC